MGRGLPAEPQMEFVRKHLTFWKMDRLSVHLFLYTEIVQKRQNFCCYSTKRQKFTQGIATVVALCYNEPEGE